MNGTNTGNATTCPRCMRPMHCGMHDATPCACRSVDVPSALLAEMALRYAGCLCIECLRELAAQAQAQTSKNTVSSSP